MMRFNPIDLSVPLTAFSIAVPGNSNMSWRILSISRGETWYVTELLVRAGWPIAAGEPGPDSGCALSIR